jgi:hypothetical protein
VPEKNNVKNDNNTFSDTNEITKMFSSDEDEDDIPSLTNSPIHEFSVDKEDEPNQSFNGTIAGSTTAHSNMK